MVLQPIFSGDGFTLGTWGALGAREVGYKSWWWVFLIFENQREGATSEAVRSVSGGAKVGAGAIKHLPTRFLNPGEFLRARHRVAVHSISPPISVHWPWWPLLLRWLLSSANSSVWFFFVFSQLWCCPILFSSLCVCVCGSHSGNAVGAWMF